ncbi:polysaccharide deacetylase family protein [Candidatus Zixiibacteriota bacterium]
MRCDRFIDRINRTAGGCIICYHHISSRALEAQLRSTSRRYTICSLDEIVSRLEDGKTTAGLMAVTFDDGFAREVEIGSALAVEYGWPMTFYLPTEFILSGQVPWFEEVGCLFKAAPGGEYKLDNLFLKLSHQSSRAAARNRVVRHLFYRPRAEIQGLMSELRQTLFGSIHRPADIQTPEPISARRVKELSEHQQISFGVHSESHPFFCTLSEEEIHREMEQSRRLVEEMIGSRAEHFCYPYGDARSIGAQAPKIAGDLFRSSTTALRGRCRPEVDLAMLPRIALFEHDTAAMAGLRVGIVR